VTTLKTLQPFNMPLEGTALIEASAGTGKTYNITSLYLRMLLERGLSVEQVLVVTFTKAATEELRERIRARIGAALRCLQGEPDSDAEVAQWLAVRGKQAADEKSLRIALASMDSAAVFTIHGFCQRVLTEHAFETGMSFDLEFIENEDVLRQQAVEDFWRQWYGAGDLDPMLAEALLQLAPSPAALLGKIDKRLSDALTVLPETRPIDELSQALPPLQQKLSDAQQAVCQAWLDDREAVKDFLHNDSGLNRRTYNSGAVEKAISAIERLCDSDRPLLQLPEKFELMCASRLKMKKNHDAPNFMVFQRCDDYLGIVQEMAPLVEEFTAAFLRKARASVRCHLQDAKRRTHQLYFDDLLTGLDRALAGESGAALRKLLRQQYPMAMIDEFQDTDAVQYRIFHAIYGERSADTGLCLIGDPKQAIYGFRGGDIYTYLQAAGDADRQYSLDTNWRSSSRLVEAVNVLFESQDRPFFQAGIDYHPVKASPVADDQPLRIDGDAPVPLQFWKLEMAEDGKPIKVDDARATAAIACAVHIAGLLQAGRTTIGEQPLCAGDIAILVRAHSHVEVIQAALSKRNINSVALSDASVYSSDEAAALLHLLEAVIGCEDEDLLRYALADRLLGYTANEIVELIEDDEQWEAVQQRFFSYRELWRERGFIQALQKLMKNEGIAARLLAQTEGERRLTNLLHLLELLQQASRTRPGLEELLRWLADEMDSAASHEEARLRLESDEALVKIVTMHSSKGLEYPVVYIPFPWTKPLEKGELPLYFHDDDGKTSLYLGGGDKALDLDANARVRREALAEELRLLYVSITRAAKLCVLTWGKVNGADKSALAWLLFPGGDSSSMGKMDEEQVFERLTELAQSAPQAIALCELPRGDQRISTALDAPPQFEPRPFTATVQRDWRVNSYSALIRGAPSDRPDYDDNSAAIKSEPPANDPVQALPAGAGFGVMVHELLEKLDFTDDGDDVLKERIGLLALRHGLPELAEPPGLNAMTTMFNRLLDTELPSAGLRLRDLPQRDRLDEMEFHFALDRLGPGKLHSMLQPFADWRDAAEQLSFSAFQGLMHGYIDLVFRHDGRYWLADYKSNRLDDYGPAALEAAMRAHHYPLQGLIYSLALHRYLAQRLSDYDPATHFGGVFYLFTRGMQPGSDDGIWFRRPDAMLLDALDTGFGGRAAA